ncbi:MAG TPA: hypothetical protein VFV05_10165 [Methylomirabilota bacterium]|nr:hypothetical protein [Methylomirabilota bacterium]
MHKLMLALLIGIIALTPAIAAAQTGASGSGKPGTSTPSAEKPGSTTPSGGSSSSPAASPSGSPSSDLSKISTKAECEKAGGMWQAAANKCEKKN